MALKSVSTASPLCTCQRSQAGPFLLLRQPQPCFGGIFGNLFFPFIFPFLPSGSSLSRGTMAGPVSLHGLVERGVRVPEGKEPHRHGPEQLVLVVVFWSRWDPVPTTAASRTYCETTQTALLQRVWQWRVCRWVMVIPLGFEWPLQFGPLSTW